ncbi:unnamed protein product, partial [Closterium sp. Yama58-4]
MAALRCPLRSRAIPACLKSPSAAQSSLPLTNPRALATRSLSATHPLHGAFPAQIPARRTIFPASRIPRVPHFSATASGASRIPRVSLVSPVSPAYRDSARSPPSAAAERSIRRGSAAACVSAPALPLNLAQVSAQLPGDLSGYMARVRECNAGLVGGRLEAAGAAERTEAVGEVLQQLREQGVVTGWRNEVSGERWSAESGGVRLEEAAGAAERTEGWQG